LSKDTESITAFADGIPPEKKKVHRNPLILTQKGRWVFVWILDTSWTESSQLLRKNKEEYATIAVQNVYWCEINVTALKN